MAGNDLKLLTKLIKALAADDREGLNDQSLSLGLPINDVVAKLTDRINLLLAGKEQSAEVNDRVLKMVAIVVRANELSSPPHETFSLNTALAVAAKKGNADVVSALILSPLCRVDEKLYDQYSNAIKDRIRNKPNKKLPRGKASAYELMTFAHVNHQLNTLSYKDAAALKNALDATLSSTQKMAVCDKRHERNFTEMVSLTRELYRCIDIVYSDLRSLELGDGEKNKYRDNMICQIDAVKKDESKNPVEKLGYVLDLVAKWHNYLGETAFSAGLFVKSDSVPELLKRTKVMVGKMNDCFDDELIQFKKNQRGQMATVNREVIANLDDFYRSLENSLFSVSKKPAPVRKA